jgi:hypothetical protein
VDQRVTDRDREAHEVAARVLAALDSLRRDGQTGRVEVHFNPHVNRIDVEVVVPKRQAA